MPQTKQQKRKNALELLGKALTTREQELTEARNLKSDDGQPLEIVPVLENKIKNIKRMVVESEAAIARNHRY